MSIKIVGVVSTKEQASEIEFTAKLFVIENRITDILKLGGDK